MSSTVSDATRSLPMARTYGAEGTPGEEAAKALTRIMLGWFLLYQGWVKVLQDISGGFGTFYQGEQFQNSQPDWLPNLLAAPYGYALPWLELGFGGLLMLGIWNRVSAGGSALIFLSILIAWLDAGNLLPRHQLMIFTPLAAWYYFAGSGRYSLDAWIARRAGRSGA